MIFALVGNQNCGKTTLFNALTGSNQHVGNFPGVTVDQKSGSITISTIKNNTIYPTTSNTALLRFFILRHLPAGMHTSA